MNEPTCRACGASITPGDRFCPRCGVTFGGSAQGSVERLSRWLAQTQGVSGSPRLATAGVNLVEPLSVTRPATDNDTAPLAIPRRRVARSRRLRLVAVAMAGVLLTIALVVALDVRRTVRTLHDVSTPPPVVSGSVLGGSGEVTIDTGPALTAVAEGDGGRDQSAVAASEETPADAQLPPPPAPTATPDDETALHAEAERAPNPANTADPEPTATLPTVQVSPTPTPTPTETLSEIERVANGDFERGDDGWDLEDGAALVEGVGVAGRRGLQLPAAGGYAGRPVKFLVGTTYQLSAWGRLSARGDTAQISVIYVDESGARRKDLEPEGLVFTGTEFEQLTTRFVVPTGIVKVTVYAWKAAGVADFFADDLSLRSVVPVEDDAAVTIRANEALTVLIMGVDARPGEAIDVGVRPDSLMVLRLDPATGSCRILAIPRDSRVELPGYGMSKINHALAVGGIPYEQQVVERFLGIEIDHYVLIDFAGFQELVDSVGGVTIDVPEGFAAVNGISFEAGRQKMDGKHALTYARFRGGPDGDFGRIQRQQQVLRALIKRASSLNVVRSLNELLPAVRDHLRTDLGTTDMASIALQYRDTCTDDAIEMIRIEGFEGWFDDPLLGMQLWYLVVDEAEVRNKVRLLFED